MLEEFRKRKLKYMDELFLECRQSGEGLSSYATEKIKGVVSDLIGEVEEEMNLNMAEQQLLGFHHRNTGYEIESLCEGMGLTKKEFDKLGEQGMIEYLTDEEKEDIENFIINL